MKQSVNYLGHIISAKGISPDPGKIETIANYKIPVNSEQLASFLELARYNRKFISNFGTIARPLSSQTKKNKKEPLVWGEPEQIAFETLRKALISPPILAFPNFDVSFQIFTDASNYGIGAILSQIQNGQEVVIAYQSRHLKPSEVKYATIEKEALAVIYAIKRFKHYLIDNEFLVISDHRPLQWLESFKDENRRLEKRGLQLTNMKYKIVHKLGRIHNNADCLSRIQSVANISETDNSTPLSQEQSKDPLCNDIKII